MELDNVKVRAQIYFEDASCPKGHGSMLQLDNGWFSVCWYCKTCKYPYQLTMRKMEHVNQENLEKALEEVKNRLQVTKKI